MNILGIEISLNEIIKFFTLYVCSIFIYIKLNNLKSISSPKKLAIIMGSIIISIFYTYVSLKVDYVIAFLSSFLLLSLMIRLFIHQKPLMSVMSITLLSLGIGYLLLCISAAIVATVSISIRNPDSNTTIYRQVAVSILLITSSILVFKIRRFKNWWYSLQNNKIGENIGIFSITLGTIVICSYNMLKKAGDYNDIALFIYPTLTIMIVGICLYQWIKKSAELQYKINLRDNNNKSLQEELNEQKKENGKLLNDNNRHAKTNHELNHKLKVIDSIIADMTAMPVVAKKFEKKYGEDFIAIINEVKEIKNRLVINKLQKKRLPVTKIFEIDRTLERLQLDALNNNIAFEVKINGKFSINYIVDEILPATQLATLLSDHIKNAIIAINSSKNTYRAICVIMGEINDNYGILIYDSGIDFDKKVLANLGKKPITTHKQEGGTGFGFMTTFETLKQVRASLVIEEFAFSKDSYTKSVGILFDNMNDYRVNSYREDEILNIDTLKQTS